MLEKIEDSMFEALDRIIDLEENESVDRQTKPILLKLFQFIEENQEMCRVLLSPNGDMSFLHRLNDVMREKCLRFFGPAKEGDFDYHYNFLMFGTAGLIRAWVNRGCAESPAQMAELADHMIRRGGLDLQNN